MHSDAFGTSLTLYGELCRSMQTSVALMNMDWYRERFGKVWLIRHVDINSIESGHRIILQPRSRQKPVGI